VAVLLCDMTEQSRRDDLESEAYVMLYFLRGTLPWQGLKAATKKQKYERISEKKMSTSIEDLCKGYPCMLHYQLLLTVILLKTNKLLTIDWALSILTDDLYCVILLFLVFIILKIVENFLKD